MPDTINQRGQRETLFLGLELSNSLNPQLQIFLATLEHRKQAVNKTLAYYHIINLLNLAAKSQSEDTEQVIVKSNIYFTFSSVFVTTNS